MVEFKTRRRGFSITELLIVIAIIVILVALLLPVLSRQKARAKRISCLNNQRQLLLGFSMYANDDVHGSFGGTPDKLKFWPYVDENWIHEAQHLQLQIFFCPSTSNGRNAAQLRVGHAYADLTIPAEDRLNNHGYSYDPLLWFADMEDYWNGNTDTKTTSRFIAKTLSNVNSYAHTNAAFSLQGSRVGPARIWLLTDNDIIGENKFWPDPNNNHGTDGATVGFADGHLEWVLPRDYVFKYEASQDNNRTKAVTRPNL